MVFPLRSFWMDRIMNKIFFHRATKHSQMATPITTDATLFTAPMKWTHLEVDRVTTF